MLPVITISRQFCSSGLDIGTLLAEKLGIRYLDKELITLAAKESGISEQFFAKADERASSSLLYSMVMGNYPFSRSMNGFDMPINDQLFILQSKLIKDEAEKGPCVIIGRCGNYILRDYPNILRVFIHANKEDRMKIAVERGHCDKTKAFDLITKMDKQRANYYNFYSNNRWDELSNYDLTINCSYFSTEQAVDLIVKAVQN